MIRRDTVSDLIRELNATDETEDLEAKECACGEVGKSTYETICALSNEPELGGGTILLGVEKEQALFPLYSPIGVQGAADKLASDIASACSTMFNSPVRLDITSHLESGAVVLKIDVPELPKTQKPLYFTKQGLPRGAFRRIGPTDIRCTDEDLLTFFQGKSHEAFDARIVKDASWDDLDPAAIGAYRNARKEANPLAEELTWSDEDMLFALGAIKRLDGKTKITNTGILLFGKTSSLRRLFPTQRVDYIRVPSRTWFPDPDTEFESIDMRGPILTLIPRIIAAIVDDLPRTLRIKDNRGGQREELPVVPYRVIREAVVNALMHRTYQVYQPIQIVRYANRLVIRNPGYSLKSQDRFDEPGSAIRNPNIAEILHETRFAETKGSGIRVMQAKMKENGLAAPTFESDRDSDEFTVICLFHHFLNESDWDWLSRFSSLDLSEDQMKALIFVREVGAIDNSTYRSLTLTDTLTASKSLRALRSMDLLNDKGSGARTHYVSGIQMLLRETAGKARRPDDSFPANMEGIHAKRPAIHVSGAPPRLEDLPSHLRIAVRTFQLKKRKSPEKAAELVLGLCSWRALSVAEIAGFLLRTPAYVSQKYLSPLIATGQLTYLFPEMVQHPQQKYVVPDTCLPPRSKISRKR